MTKRPKKFRKMSVAERRDFLRKLPGVSEEDLRILGDTADWADRMAENVIGTFPVPLGLVSGLLVNGKDRILPLATEEPSVIAAAEFAARLTAPGGGFRARSGPSLTGGQVFLENPEPDSQKRLEDAAPRIEVFLKEEARSLEKRGGGFRSLRFRRFCDHRGTPFLCLDFFADVGDAMGANIVNRMGEAVSPLLEEISGADTLMAILSNEVPHRLTEASFSMDLAGDETFLNRETARRITAAARVAAADPSRAVTHNKGIMNGISALALATGNDTRGCEAAVHAYAGARFPYRPLSSYRLKGSLFQGFIRLPLSLATAGTGLEFHPVARLSLKILGRPSARELAETAAALGLAQNLAALRALVSEGIREGHMKLHDRRQNGR